MSINTAHFFRLIQNEDISFFTGVPDSLLKNFCLCIDNNVSKNDHIIAANEGNAIAIAAGYFLATNKVPIVYMQNSGLGNAINPLLSLCDSSVYSIPLVLVIGWRGEPGVPDEPQHIKQGEIQLDLLKLLKIPYEVLSGEEINYRQKVEKIIQIAKNKNKPTALLIKKKTFTKYELNSSENQYKGMRREEALEIILEFLPYDAIIVSTTGKTSREIYEIRERKKEPHKKDFLTVGSMGHCSSIALGLAISKPNRKVFCIDGDGALIMHMGSLSSVGKLNPKNFYHILMNNEVHESVGGQATASSNINFQKLTQSNGYNKSTFVEKKEELEIEMKYFLNEEGPNFIEVKINPGSRKDLGRPASSPIDNKKQIMDYIKN